MNNRIKKIFYNNITLKKLIARPIIKDTLITTILGIAGRSAGLLIPFFVSAWFGISEDTDTFFFALGILVFFSGVFAWAVESVIVPFVAKLRYEGQEQVIKFVSSLLLICLLFLTGTLIFSLLVAKPILSLLTYFSSYSMNLLWIFLLEITPIILLMTASGILSGVLNSYKVFGIPALLRSLSLIIILGIAYLLKGTFGIHALAFGYIVGETCRFIFLLWAFHQKGIGLIQFSLQQKKAVWEFFKISIYMIIGMCIAGLPPIINRTIASHFDQGSVSVLEYAEKMFYIPAGILGSGFLTVILSYWSKGFQEEGSQRLWKSVLLVTKLMIFLSFGAAVFLFAFRHLLASIAIGWGRIDEEKIAEVGQLFGIYLLGLVPNILNLILGRAHLVLKNTAILMKAAFIGVGILLLLNAVITPNMGLKGIALSLAGSQIFVSLFLFFTLEKSLRIQNERL